MSSTSEALQAVEEIVAEGGEADDTLRRVVAALHERGGYAWAGLFFVEDGALALGPEAGTADEARRVRVPVIWQGVEVAQLAVDGGDPADLEPLAQIATLVSGQCLVGWDTGGEPWES
jgi:putative methionine-R-sulfoxide reductase with GAF domain